MQPKYLTILTLPLKANEKTIFRFKKMRWSSYNFVTIFVYFWIFYYFLFSLFRVDAPFVATLRYCTGFSHLLKNIILFRVSNKCNLILYYMYTKQNIYDVKFSTE